MIADAHLDIHREAHSTPWLSDVVFGEAQRLSYGRYFLNSPRAIEDDQLPFLELGVAAIDIIDLDYGPFNLYWRSRSDAVDKCSPASLAIVARVVLATLAALETNLPSRPGGVPYFGDSSCGRQSVLSHPENQFAGAYPSVRA